MSMMHWAGVAAGFLIALGVGLLLVVVYIRSRQDAAPPPELRVGAEIGRFPAGQQGAEQINKPKSGGPEEDNHHARPVRMIEYSELEALDGDIEEKSDAERQDEK